LVILAGACRGPCNRCVINIALRDQQVTTASNASFISFRDNRLLQVLCLAMAVVIIVTGYRPEKVFDWWLENAAALSFLAALGISYRRLPLSDLSYRFSFT
jgi:hypothetical protein